MNRHERRKAEVFERRTMSADELSQMGSACAWDGCAEIFKGAMPKGWNWMVAYWAPRPHGELAKVGNGNWMRDACLCPKHSADLDAQLKSIGQVDAMPTMGEA